MQAWKGYYIVYALTSIIGVQHDLLFCLTHFKLALSKGLGRRADDKNPIIFFDFVEN